MDPLFVLVGPTAGGKSRAAVPVARELEAEHAGTLQLDVSYRLPGAGWRPAYEARAETGTDAVELVSYGLVRQRTGEDWRDVRLTLSTAKPTIAGSMPRLEPLKLRPWQPIELRKKAEVGFAAMAEAPRRTLERVSGEELDEELSELEELEDKLSEVTPLVELDPMEDPLSDDIEELTD